RSPSRPARSTDRRPGRAIRRGYDPKGKTRPIPRLRLRARVQRAGAGRRRGRKWECRMRISFASNTEGARVSQVRWGRPIAYHLERFDVALAGSEEHRFAEILRLQQL